MHEYLLCPILSIKTAAEITGLSQYYIRNGCRAGTIPHIMSGNRYKVDLQRFAETISSSGSDNFK